MSGRLETRIKALEKRAPGEPQVIRFIMRGDNDTPLTPEEEGYLLEEEERQMEEARRQGKPTVYALWTRERAQELGASRQLEQTETELSFVWADEVGNVISSQGFRMSTMTE